MLQVDRVEWPSDVAQLGRAAGGILEALAEQLRSSAAEGRNVIALGNCHRGDGSTTLLLCIARCLSGRGLKVAVVDADFRRPRLARRLGILPETGWDEVLDGRATLGDAVIESLRDRLAILPLREPPEGRSGSPPAADGLGSSLAALRLHFDVVLIDLGSCRREHPLLPRSDSPNSWIDRVLLVRNVRTTPTSDLTEACRRVRSSGIGEVGVVENFV